MAAQSAEDLSPGAISPIVAENVLAFNKDNPMDAIRDAQQAAGRATRKNAEIFFHLGILLEFWIKQLAGHGHRAHEARPWRTTRPARTARPRRCSSPA